MNKLTDRFKKASRNRKTIREILGLSPRDNRNPSGSNVQGQIPNNQPQDIHKILATRISTPQDNFANISGLLLVEDKANNKTYVAVRHPVTREVYYIDQDLFNEFFGLEDQVKKLIGYDDPLQNSDDFISENRFLLFKVRTNLLNLLGYSSISDITNGRHYITDNVGIEFVGVKSIGSNIPSGQVLNKIALQNLSAISFLRSLGYQYVFDTQMHSLEQPGHTNKSLLRDWIRLKTGKPNVGFSDWGLNKAAFNLNKQIFIPLRGNIKETITTFAYNLAEAIAPIGLRDINKRSVRKKAVTKFLQSNKPRTSSYASNLGYRTFLIFIARIFRKTWSLVIDCLNSIKNVVTKVFEKYVAPTSSTTSNDNTLSIVHPTKEPPKFSMKLLSYLFDIPEHFKEEPEEIVLPSNMVQMIELEPLSEENAMSVDSLEQAFNELDSPSSEIGI